MAEVEKLLKEFRESLNRELEKVEDFKEISPLFG